MRVYLASRFSRLPELLEYKRQLEEVGIEVTSRWLLGGHEWSGTDDDALPCFAAARFAAEDLADIEAAEFIVCFTEAPRSGPSRGGRHVEMGFALASAKPIIVVGHRENVFCCLPEIEFASTWEEAYRRLVLAAQRRERVAS